MKRLDYLLIILFTAVIGLSSLPVLTYPLGRDQGEFATIAQAILDGKTVYVDIWNPKPPAIFYVYSLFVDLFGNTARSVRLIDFAILPFMTYGLYWLGLTLSTRSVSILAVIAYGAYYFTNGFWSLSQNDGIAMLPMLYSLICMYLASNTKLYHWLWALSAGILAGVTFWFKYPFALLVLGIGLGMLPLQPSRGHFLKNLTALIIGGLIVVVGGFWALESKGALDAFIESAQVTSSYTRESYNLDEFLHSPIWINARETRWAHWRILFVLTVLAIPQIWIFRHQRTPKMWWPIWGWWFGAWGVLLVQAKGSGYHWLPLLPPMVLLAAQSWSQIADWLITQLSQTRYNAYLGDNPLLKVNSLVSVGVIFYLIWTIWSPSWDYMRGIESQNEYYQDFIGGEYSASESQQVVNYLDERLVDGESLYIYGFRSEIYYLSGLRPATRFMFNFPLIGEWYPEEWRQENVDVLWSAMPKYVLIMQADYMPWVTSRDEDSNTLLQEDTELNNWLIANYERDTQIGNFIVWRHKDLQ